VSLNFLFTFFKFSSNKAIENFPLDDGIECFFARIRFNEEKKKKKKKKGKKKKKEYPST
jgi:hypothetical protein